MAYIREYPPNHLTPKKQNLYLRRRNSKSGIIIALAGLKTSTDNADRLLNASLSSGRPHNVRVCQLLFYGKCTGFTVCFSYSDISLSMSINQYYINVELPYLWYIVVLLPQKRFFERF